MLSQVPPTELAHRLPFTGLLLCSFQLRTILGQVSFTQPWTLFQAGHAGWMGPTPQCFARCWSPLRGYQGLLWPSQETLATGMGRPSGQDPPRQSTSGFWEQEAQLDAGQTLPAPLPLLLGSLQRMRQDRRTMVLPGEMELASLGCLTGLCLPVFHDPGGLPARARLCKQHSSPR